jgi:hypothetical protein
MSIHQVIRSFVFTSAAALAALLLVPMVSAGAATSYQYCSAVAQVPLPTVTLTVITPAAAIRSENQVAKRLVVLKYLSGLASGPVAQTLNDQMAAAFAQDTALAALVKELHASTAPPYLLVVDSDEITLSTLSKDQSTLNATLERETQEVCK